MTLYGRMRDIHYFAHCSQNNDTVFVFFMYLNYREKVKIKVNRLFSVQGSIMYYFISLKVPSDQYRWGPVGKADTRYGAAENLTGYRGLSWTQRAGIKKYIIIIYKYTTY